MLGPIRPRPPAFSRAAARIVIRSRREYGRRSIVLRPIGSAVEGGVAGQLRSVITGRPRGVRWCMASPVFSC